MTFADQVEHVHRPLRLLLMVPYAPRLDAMDGGGRVTAQLIVRLARRHEVAVLYVRSPQDREPDAEVRAAVAVLREAVRPPARDDRRYRWSVRIRNGVSMLRGRPRRATAAMLPALEQSLSELVASWRPTIIQVEFEEMAQYLFALPDRGVPRLVTVHDPGAWAARERRRSVTGGRRLIAELDLLAWRRFERRIFASVDVVVALTERDRGHLARFEDAVRIAQIPLGTDLPELPLDPVGGDDRGVLFVGSYPHAPNVDAALRLAHGILPIVRLSRPDATLTLVGTRPPPELVEAAGEGVIVTGGVPDVTPYLARAAVVALPLRLGGGMRVKLLEALAAGKAVVCSRLTAEGLVLGDGVEVVFAESDREFAEAIVRLLDDRALRRDLGRRARAWAEKNLRAQDRVEAYERLYDSLLLGTVQTP